MTRKEKLVSIFQTLMLTEVEVHHKDGTNFHGFVDTVRMRSGTLKLLVDPYNEQFEEIALDDIQSFTVMNVEND